MEGIIEREYSDGTLIVSIAKLDGATEVGLQVNGTTVSRIVIVPMLMRIGAAVVRMDGIGGVATDEAYQRRGYARRLMDVAVAKMGAGDAALSTLYGIPDFYPKFGYTTVGPEYTLTLDLPADGAAPPALPRGWTFRPFQLEDLPAVQRIYHANTRYATGPLVRHEVEDELDENRRLARASPTARQVGQRAWNRLLKTASGTGDDACRVLFDETGAIVAYAWTGAGWWWIDFRRQRVPDSFHLGEVMAVDPVAADAVLTACLTWAAEAGTTYARIELALPAEGHVASAAAYEGGHIHAAFSRRGEFMGRVLDVRRLLDQLRPELSARLGSANGSFAGALALCTDEGTATTRMTADDIADEDGAHHELVRVELPQDALARLCLGAFDVDDLLVRLPRPPSDDAAAMLKVLFPRRTPHIYPADRF